LKARPTVPVVVVMATKVAVGVETEAALAETAGLVGWVVAGVEVKAEETAAEGTAC